MLSTFDWIVFDAMGVVYEVGDDTADLLIPFVLQRAEGVTPGRISEVYHSASLGLIDAFEFWQALGLGERYPAIEEEYLGLYTLNEDLISLCRRLKGFNNLALLSNDLGQWSRKLREIHGISELFDLTVISGDIGAKKPDIRIYLEFLAKSGVPPDRCLFIDDRTDNLEAARNLGIEGYLYEGESSLAGLEGVILRVPNHGQKKV